MKPTSVSASSLKGFQNCPAGWHSSWMLRTPSPTGMAAELGTALHTALEKYVKFEHFKHDGEEADAAIEYFMAAAVEGGLDFNSVAAGKDIIHKWVPNNAAYLNTVEVISTEEKHRYPMDMGDRPDMPLTYIIDRLERDPTGEINVVDYKSSFLNVTPDALRNDLQARIYAMVAQILYPDEARIWVTFDMLRYEPVSVAFTKEENRETYFWVKRMIGRIYDTEEHELQERIGDGCRYCARKLRCESMKLFRAATDMEILLGDTPLDQLALDRHQLATAQKSLTTLLQEYDEALALAMDKAVLEFATAPYAKGLEVAVQLTTYGRKKVSNERLADVLAGRCAEFIKVYGGITATAVKNCIEDPESRFDDLKPALTEALSSTRGETRVGTRLVPAG